MNFTFRFTVKACIKLHIKFIESLCVPLSQLDHYLWMNYRLFATSKFQKIFGKKFFLDSIEDLAFLYVTVGRFSQTLPIVHDHT